MTEVAYKTRNEPGKA